ncbi:MAG TPA: ABC transporter permease, partial [Burkholderiales bacterium]|nr:ABC transporter permease [Burkholderiales bacterium]
HMDVEEEISEEIIIEEPEAAFSFMSLGPGLVMNLSDLPSTGLVREGSRVHYVLYVAGNPSKIAAYRQWAKSRLGRGQRLEDAREGSPQIRDMLDHSNVFLRMAALFSVVLAAVAVSLSVRRFFERHLDGCAVMRVIGATSSRLFRLFLCQFSILGVAAGILGGLAGYFAQKLLASILSGFITVDLPRASVLPACEGLAAGLVLLLGFSLPLVHALSKVPALRVIRREMIVPRGGYALGLAALLFLFLWQAKSLELGLIVFGSFCVMLLFSAVAVRFFLGRLKGGGSGWRYGMASLRRRSASGAVQIVAFGIGLMAVLSLTLVRGDLFETWQETLPPHAPNRFILNIQKEEIAPLSLFFSNNGMKIPEFYPMVRGRLVAINGKPVSSKNYQASRAKRLVDREFNLSWAGNQGNEIASGKWWGAEGKGKPYFSVEEELAKTLSIGMGDTLTFEIAGNRLTGRVTNFRRVDWNSFKVNFFVLTPPGVLDAYPTSYITSFYVPSGNYGKMGELSRAFPTLLVI